MRMLFCIVVLAAWSAFGGIVAAQAQGAIVFIPRPSQFVEIQGLAAAASIDVEIIPAHRIAATFVWPVRYSCGEVREFTRQTASGAQIFVGDPLSGDDAEVPAEPPPMPFGFAMSPPGTYTTAITISNMSFGNVSFTKRAIETLPQRSPQGQVGLPVEENLLPDSGIIIDCADIMALFGSSPPASPFSQGVVMIRIPGPPFFTQQPLHVQALWTFKEFDIAYKFVRSTPPYPIFVTPPPHPENR